MLLSLPRVKTIRAQLATDNLALWRRRDLLIELRNHYIAVLESNPDLPPEIRRTFRRQ